MNNVGGGWLIQVGLLLACAAACSSNGAGGGATTQAGASGAGTGGGAGAATAGGGGAGKGGSAGSTFVECATGVHCNGQCLVNVGDEAGGCKLLLGTTVGALFADDALYYGSLQGAVVKLDFVTLTESVLAPRVEFLSGMAVDGTHAYYAGFPDLDVAQDLVLQRVPRAGGTPEVVIGSVEVEDELKHLRVLGGALYYLNAGPFEGQLMRVEGNTATAVLPGVGIDDYRMDATHLYYLEATGATSSAIRRVPLATLSGPETLAEDLDIVDELAVQGDHVYWLSIDEAVMRAPKTGGAPEIAVSFGSMFGEIGAALVHADGAALYVVTRHADHNRLWSLASGSTEPRQVATLARAGLGIPSVTTDANYIYVSPPYGVLRLSK